RSCSPCGRQRLGELDEDPVPALRVNEQFPPLGVLVVLAHHPVPGRPELRRPPREIPDLERNVVEAFAAAVEEAVQETIRAPRLEQCDGAARKGELLKGESPALPGLARRAAQQIPKQIQRIGDPAHGDGDVVECDHGGASFWAHVLLGASSCEAPQHQSKRRGPAPHFAAAGGVPRLLRKNEGKLRGAGPGGQLWVTWLSSKGPGPRSAGSAGPCGTLRPR